MPDRPLETAPSRPSDAPRTKRRGLPRIDFVAVMLLIIVIVVLLFITSELWLPHWGAQ